MDSLPSVSNIQVACRIRPPLPQEDQLQISIHGKHQIQLSDHSDVFSLDMIFPPNASQEQVFQQCAQEAVENVLLGYNSSILAYGQTSSGKTHTMLGIFKDEIHSKTGLIPRCINHILQYKHLNRQREEVTVSCSMVEIYNDEIFDLQSNGERKSIRTTNKGISQPISMNIDSLALLHSFLSFTSKRIVSATGMNAVSSRSHLVVVAYVTKQYLKDLSKVESQLCLVDLAGSERAKKTKGDQGQQRQGSQINLSLSSLATVIRDLSKRKVPKYRDSTLTLFLKDSLGGNCKTTFLVCISPATENRQQSINTLKFSQFSRKVTCSATIFLKKNPNFSEREAQAASERTQLLEKEIAHLKRNFYILMTEGVTGALTTAQTYRTAFVAVKKELKLTRATLTSLARENAQLKKEAQRMHDEIEFWRRQARQEQGQDEEQF